MILRGGRVAISANRAEAADLYIAAGRIRAMAAGIAAGKGVDLRGCLILPGLINAHDHLEFNLFPRLGRGPYRNAGEWARDIHASFPGPIRKTLAVPLDQRLRWGAIKNLLSGVTTVCHHNPWSGAFGGGFPVRVVSDFSWAHSLEFSRDLQARHASCSWRRPFVFHAGEATGASARREMESLEALGLFAANSVMVHAVGLRGKWMRLAIARRCSVVWCPSSNLFTLGATLSRRVLDSGLTVALGTDSTLTAEGDMLDELRVARQVSGLSAERLYRMVTGEPAKALRLRNGAGTVRAGNAADLVVYRDLGRTPAQTLLEQRPEAVIAAGKAQMVAGDAAERWEMVSRLRRFTPLRVAGQMVLLRMPPPPLGHEIRLAGRQVTR